MLFLILFLLTVITMSGVLGWAVVKSSAARPLRDSAQVHATVAIRPRQPESLEGVLVAQLMTGEITRAQYLQAIGGIAAREDERHPLTVPPETGPANT